MERNILPKIKKLADNYLTDFQRFETDFKEIIGKDEFDGFISICQYISQKNRNFYRLFVKSVIKTLAIHYYLRKSETTKPVALTGFEMSFLSFMNTIRESFF